MQTFANQSIDNTTICWPNISYTCWALVCSYFRPSTFVYPTIRRAMAVHNECLPAKYLLHIAPLDLSRPIFVAALFQLFFGCGTILFGTFFGKLFWMLFRTFFGHFLRQCFGMQNMALKVPGRSQFVTAISQLVWWGTFWESCLLTIFRTLLEHFWENCFWGTKCSTAGPRKATICCRPFPTEDGSQTAPSTPAASRQSHWETLR